VAHEENHCLRFHTPCACLAETEKDDGRLHNLEVRVKAPDAKGKLRKLEVSSRRGYYMSEMGEKEKEATAAKAQ